MIEIVLVSVSSGHVILRSRGKTTAQCGRS